MGKTFVVRILYNKGKVECSSQMCTKQCPHFEVCKEYEVKVIKEIKQEDYLEVFRENLKMYRKKHNITISDMAKDLGIAPSTLSQCERNLAEFNQTVLERIEIKYGIKVR